MTLLKNTAVDIQTVCHVLRAGWKRCAPLARQPAKTHTFEL